MKPQPIDRWDRETTLVVQIAAFASLLSFLYFFRHGDLLLYGDAVAHINIARRVFDSRTPGLLQLGTVWLPLPHLLMIPFLFADSAWRTGIGGSIPSLAAYVLGTVGVFRLARSVLSRDGKPDPTVRAAAWAAAVIYAANPNLLYLQSTAMTESLYLALFIWAVVYFAEFAKATATSDKANVDADSSLAKCGFCLLGACLTRYDGWFLTSVVGLAALVIVLKSHRNQQTLRRSFVKFILLTAVAPVFWLAYNAAVYRNPLEFANGPYSAPAIAQRSATATMPSHPGAHDLPTAASFFLKAGELVMAEGNWHRLWVLLLAAGALMILIFEGRLWPLLLLLLPIPFYALSIADGGVPIYLPVWWPFSSYNTRYGLELLPGFAVLAAVAAYFLLGRVHNKTARAVVGFVFAGWVGISYAGVWRTQPVCYREAVINSRTRIALETELASNLRMLPHDSTLLMYLGDHVGALQQAGIPLHRVINEGNHRPWRKPLDESGLWEQALANPKQHVDYVIALDGDPVAASVQKRDLQSMTVVHATGQPPATIYWTQRSSR